VRSALLTARRERASIDLNDALGLANPRSGTVGLSKQRIGREKQNLTAENVERLRRIPPPAWRAVRNLIQGRTAGGNRPVSRGAK
jgi:hypothetical protein